MHTNLQVRETVWPSLKLCPGYVRVSRQNYHASEQLPERAVQLPGAQQSDACLLYLVHQACPLVHAQCTHRLVHHHSHGPSMEHSCKGQALQLALR